MVITKNSVSSNIFFNCEDDIEMARFTAAPMRSLIDVIGTILVEEYTYDRRNWKETEMHVGELKRLVPFLTNNSKFRNDMLKYNIYHNLNYK